MTAADLQTAFLWALYIHLIVRLEAALVGERAINQLLKGGVS